MKKLIGVLVAFFLIGLLVVPACAGRQSSIVNVIKPKGWYVQKKDNLQNENQEAASEGTTGQDKKAAQAQIKENNRTIIENDKILLRLKTEINKQNLLVNYKLSRLKRGNSAPSDSEAVKRGLAALKADRQTLNQALVSLNGSKALLNNKRQVSHSEILKTQDQYLAAQQRCISLMQAVLGDLQQIQKSL